MQLLRKGPWAFREEALPLAIPYRWAHGTQHVRHVLLARCGTGWGEMAPPPHLQWDGRDSVARAQTACRGDVTALPRSRLRCALTTAAADDAAREAGLGLAQWWGDMMGRTPRRCVAVNRLLTAASPAALAEQAMAAMAEGITTLKIKIGADVEGDLARVAAVRAAAPRATLRLDANTALPRRGAEAALQAFAEHDIAYIEQPLPPEDREGLRELQALGAIPIALDESATDATTIAALLADELGDVVILKPQRLGGIDATVEAMEAAESAGATAVVTNSLESSVGVHAALHAAALLKQDVACGLATSHYLARDVAPPPAIVDGRMTVPSHGLGVSP